VKCLELRPLRASAYYSVAGFGSLPAMVRMLRDAKISLETEEVVAGAR